MAETERPAIEDQLGGFGIVKPFAPGMTGCWFIVHLYWIDTQVTGFV
jgi:hypothetical protein